MPVETCNRLFQDTGSNYLEIPYLRSLMLFKGSIDGPVSCNGCGHSPVL